MANYSRIKGLTVVISADTTELTKKLDSFAKQTNKVTTALKDVNKLLKLNPTSTELLTQKQKLLKEQVDKTKEQLDAEKLALEQLKASGDKTEAVIQKQERLKRQIEETKAKLKEAEQAYHSFGSVGIQQLNAVGEKMMKLGDSMMQVGKKMSLYVTAPIVGLGTFAVKELADFEQSMAQVGAVAQASGEELDAMSEYAREVASTTKFTAGEVTDAYYYMSLAGWTPQESMNALVDMLNLVSASGEDLGRVSDIVTDGMTAFQLSSEEASRFVDVLAVAMSNTNTTVDQLGDAFKYVAPVAGSMGYEIEDVAVALGVMANNGIKGSTAGTTLRNILTNLAKPTDEIANAMYDLGISLEDDEGNMYSFAEVMNQFRTSLGNIKIPIEEYRREMDLLDEALIEGTLSEDQYVKAVEEVTQRAYGAEGALMAKYSATIAGKRGMAGLMSIVSASDEDWNNLTNAINGSTGASEEMRKKMEDTLQGQLLILKSEVSELAMQFGEALMPTIREVVDWLKQLVNKFQNLSPETKAMIAKIAGLVAVIGPLLVAGGALIKGIGFFLTIPAKIVAGVSTIIGVFSKIIAFLGPYGLIALAVGALVVVIVKNWDWIKEKAVEIWSAVSDFFKKTWEKIKNTAVTIWGGIKKAGEIIWNGIKLYYTTLFDFFKNYFSNIWNGIKNVVLGVWNGLKTQAQIIWNALKMAVTDPIGALKYFLSSTWENIKTTASKVWEGIKKVITAPIDSAVTTVQNLIQKIKNFFPIRLSNIFSGLKLPHINVTTKKGLFGISYPSFSVDWYKKAYNNGIMFNSPTVLPTLNGYKGFGDGNGAELVIGQNSLMSMIQRASSNNVDANAIYNAVMRGASQARISVYIDGKDVTAVVNRHNTMQQISNQRFAGALR